MPLTVAASTVSSNEIGEREVVHVLGPQMCRALRRGVVAGPPRALARAPARATVDVNGVQKRWLTWVMHATSSWQTCEIYNIRSSYMAQ